MKTLITGPPGSGKTTTYINNLQNKNPHMRFYVCEPYQSIVRSKRIGAPSDLIKYLNWAEALSNEGIEDFVIGRDVAVIDEAHLIFKSEYRDFDVKTIKEIQEKYKNVIYITATPNEIIRYINENKMTGANHVRINKRLKRPSIKINIINKHLKNFLDTIALRKYNIINTNNMKALYKMSEYISTDKFAKDSILICSTYAEQNNILTAPKYIDDVTTTSGSARGKELLIGTVAMAQGVDKDRPDEESYEKTISSYDISLEDLFRLDKKENKRKTEILTEFILYDANSLKEKDIPETTLYEYIAEGIIQLDRFRYDTDIEIDMLYTPKEGEDISFLIGEIEGYINSVYNTNETEITNIEINIIDDNEIIFNPLLRVIKPYRIKDLEECMKSYDPAHKINKKSEIERLKDIFMFFIDDTDDVYKRRNGMLKSTVKITDIILTKYMKGTSLLKDDIYNENIFKTINAVNELLKYVKAEGIIKRYREMRAAEFKDERKRDEHNIKDENDIHKIIRAETGLFFEAIYTLVMKQIGIKINHKHELDGRGGNDIQLTPNILRSFIINEDYDVKGAHITALVKALDYNYDVKSLLNVKDIYTTTKQLEMKDFYNVLKSMKGAGDLTDEYIKEYYGSDRNVIKQALLNSINSMSVEIRRNLVIRFIQDTFGLMVNEYVINELNDKLFKLLPYTHTGMLKIGYSNGILYEREWFGHLNDNKNFVRIADGFATLIDGEDGNAERNRIENEYKISIVKQKLKKMEGIEIKNFNYFYQRVEAKSQEEMREYNIKNFGKMLKLLADMAAEETKGRHKGKNIGKAVGKAVGKAEGKAVAIKRYLCIKDFEYNGKSYKQGAIYEFGKDFINSVGNYGRRYMNRVK